MHLPVYTENAYQPRLMDALRTLGVVAIDGGGGGNFFRTALFKWKADVLHFHWLHPYWLRKSRLGSLIRGSRFLCEVNSLRAAGSRIVWTIHNLSNHSGRQVRLENFFSVHFARNADGIITHSQHALELATESFCLQKGKLTAVIPQGGYVNCYPNVLSRSECRRQLGIAEDALVFVFLGRIEPYKGALELVHAFRQLPDPAQLLIAGRSSSVEFSERIREAARGARNIHLHEGFVADDRVQTFLNAANAYVYPVRDILNSASLALAMSFGLACVAPRLPGVLDTLGADGGIFYRQEDPDGLLRAMREAMARKSELQKIGALSLAKAREWTWDKVAERTRKVYDQCLAA